MSVHIFMLSLAEICRKYNLQFSTSKNEKNKKKIYFLSSIIIIIKPY